MTSATSVVLALPLLLAVAETCGFDFADPAVRAAAERCTVRRPEGGSPPRTSPKTLDGVDMAEALRRHRYNLLFTWYTECAPCKEVLPDWNDLAANLENSSVGLLAPTLDQHERARDFVQSSHVQGIVVADALDFLAELELMSFPSLALVDQRGRLIIHFDGTRACLRDGTVMRELKGLGVLPVGQLP